MKWTETTVKYIIKDMIDENPLASRAFLSINEIVFTTKVDTLAVSAQEHPTLLINLDFCRKNFHTENDLKAVLLHEFLHVLLLHTNKYEINTPLLNFCLDAIINSIIHRCMGSTYSDFFARFYKWEKWTFLLRPAKDKVFKDSQWNDLHQKIYHGRYSADELYELLSYLISKGASINAEKIDLLGNHDKGAGKVAGAMGKLLDDTLAKMNGTKIWNKSKKAGIGVDPEMKTIDPDRRFRERWKKETYEILKKCLLPDTRLKLREEESSLSIPVMSVNDMRASAKMQMSQVIPFFNHTCTKHMDCLKATIYLDVSGSMEPEIQMIADLLTFFKSFIKLPLYVFSDQVNTAEFTDCKLSIKTSFGTNLQSVITHIEENKVKKALIVTDGYFEKSDVMALRKLDKKKPFFLISSSGNTKDLHFNNIAYRQLPEFHPHRNVIKS